ncbi:MAG: non-reducing end alpha-L-arabinofuranosidase family hydrolase [Acidobacteriota bacterium]
MALRPLLWCLLISSSLAANSVNREIASAARPDAQTFLQGRFKWQSSGPLLTPAARSEDPCHAIKDPSVVRYEGRWHVFCTIRSQKRSHQIEYLSFEDWSRTQGAKREILKLTDGYFCAPQVFYFSPHRKWYLVYQVSEPSRKPALQPAFSTTADLGDPYSWTQPTLLFARHPENIKQWIDFWIICDERKAHLFFTSLDGCMWRSETALAQFPRGWDAPRVALRGDVYEASHTYLLRKLGRYLTLIEAQDRGRRYYKAYLAERLDGAWEELAGTRKKPFVAPESVTFEAEKWTDSFSHGELLRAGYDERLEVDPAQLRFLFQGVADQDRIGKKYGEIPWRLGLLTAEAGP